MPHTRASTPARSRPLLAAALLALTARPAAAQVVRGEVVDGASGRALADYTAQLLDGAGRVVAAALAGEGGRYTLRAPGAGSFQVRVLRVGYRSALSPAFALRAGETREQAMRAPPVPVALGALRVSDRQRCEVRPAEGALAGALWAEVQKAALAVRLTGDDARLRLAVRESRRRRSADGSALLADSSVERQGRGGPPYVSPPAEVLARGGYVQTVAEGDARRTWFYAPDAAALLSEGFVATHCFRVDDPVAADGLVALRFEPLRRGAPPDIRGVLRVDRETAELRELEFEYTALPRAAARQAFGGRVRFQRVPGGAWIVRDWRVRAPVLRPVARAVAGGSLDAPGAPSLGRVLDSVLVAVQEEEGEVLRAATAEGTTLWAADALATPPASRCDVAREAREREIASALATPPERWHPSGADSLAVVRAIGEATVVLQAVADTLGDADPGTARALRGREHAAYPHALTALTQAYFDVEEPVAGCRVRRVVLLPLRLRAPAVAVIAGRVVDGRERPVAGAAVAVAEGGPEVRTDSAGTFALAAGTAREAAVTVRRLGYGPADFTVPLAPGDTARVLVQLRRVGVLDTVRTVGAGRVPAQLAGFETRRALGRGTFVTREQIAERRGVSTADIVRATGAVRVVDSLGALLPTSQRGGRWDARRSRFDAVCVLRVAVDGIMMNPGFSLGELPPPGELAGIEIYKGAASMPSDFAAGRSDSYCGLVAVWTRSR